MPGTDEGIENYWLEGVGKGQRVRARVKGDNECRAGGPVAASV